MGTAPRVVVKLRPHAHRGCEHDSSLDVVVTAPGPVAGDSVLITSLREATARGHDEMMFVMERTRLEAPVKEPDYRNADITTLPEFELRVVFASEGRVVEEAISLREATVREATERLN